MLKLLSITNFAVVSEATIEFGEGLNLLTGETGSGKSIVVDALGLLLGARASAEIVRTGETSAYIEGIFSIEHNPELVRLASEAGIDLSEGELIIRREISDRARSRAYVNDRLATIAFLKAIQPLVVDIHGQGDQQALLYPEAHIDLLDDFGNVGELRDLVNEKFGAYVSLRRELTSLERTEAERLRSLDILRFQVAEIEAANLHVGEDETLDAERTLLVNAEKLVQLSSEGYSVLYEDEGAVLPRLGHVERRLEQISRYDKRFEPYQEGLVAAKYALEDLAFFLRDYLQDIDFSQDRLKHVDERLLEIDRLKRKYGATVSDVLETLRDMQGRLDDISRSEERAESISSALSESKAAYIQAARELSLARAEASRRLEERVMEELAELAMGDTFFAVRIVTSDEDDALRASGIDDVEFFVATNPGEEPRPLAKIASGGEISRLMLALKTVSSPPEIPRSLVFDEVDVGIGGRVSEKIGQRLANLSRGNQVLCVTHQAQIARFADHHFTVAKRLVGDRVETHVSRLDRKGQVEELARMIGGADITETARRHARELLRAK